MMASMSARREKSLVARKPCSKRALDLRHGYAEDVGSTGFKVVYFFGVNVESSDLESRFGKKQREGQTDISKSDDSDFGSSRVDAVHSLPGDFGQRVLGNRRHVLIVALQLPNSYSVIREFLVNFAENVAETAGDDAKNLQGLSLKIMHKFSQCRLCGRPR